MKNVVITGSKGQLGSSIHALEAVHPALRFIYADIEQLDLTDKNAVIAFLKANKTDYVLNCAAYTAVDKAEDEPELCDLVNHIGAGNVGEAAALIQAKVIHISTDYVFDGTGYRPYVETDKPCPTSVYGESKRKGEEAIRKACPESIIIRTSWLYSEYGNNFVKTMLRLGRERDELSIIYDQTGTPTYAGDLASAMLAIVEAQEFVSGVYHYSNEGVCSWYDFALKTLQVAGIECRIHPIESKEYPTKATRPHYSVLNKSKIKSTYGLVIPHWEASLKNMLSHLK